MGASAPKGAGLASASPPGPDGWPAFEVVCAALGSRAMARHLGGHVPIREARPRAMAQRSRGRAQSLRRSRPWSACEPCPLGWEQGGTAKRRTSGRVADLRQGLSRAAGHGLRDGRADQAGGQPARGSGQVREAAAPASRVGERRAPLHALGLCGDDPGSAAARVLWSPGFGMALCGDGSPLARCERFRDLFTGDCAAALTIC